MSKPPESIRKYMAEIGRKGGKAKGKSKARDPEKMSAAGRRGAAKRWKGHKRKEEPKK